MIELKNKNELENLLKDGLVLVDFNATWCGPCQQLKPILAELSSQREDIKIISIDVDEYPELSKEYGIMSIPNLKLLKDGKIIKEHIGYMNKSELIAFLNVE